MALCALAAVSWADRSLKTMVTQRIPFRAYVGATPIQYDTLAVVAGERVELVNFQMFMDDSAMTPTLNVSFLNAADKRVYFKITPQTFTANQQLTYALAIYGPVVFPPDTSVLIFYNITSTAPGTLDTLNALTTYRAERY
jgi:hypothetical protein